MSARDRRKRRRAEMEKQEGIERPVSKPRPAAARSTAEWDGGAGVAKLVRVKGKVLQTFGSKGGGGGGGGGGGANVVLQREEALLLAEREMLTVTAGPGEAEAAGMSLPRLYATLLGDGTADGAVPSLPQYLAYAQLRERGWVLFRDCGGCGAAGLPLVWDVYRPSSSFSKKKKGPPYAVVAVDSADSGSCPGPAALAALHAAAAARAAACVAEAAAAAAASGGGAAAAAAPAEAPLLVAAVVAGDGRVQFFELRLEPLPNVADLPPPGKQAVKKRPARR